MPMSKPVVGCGHGDSVPSLLPTSTSAKTHRPRRVEVPRRQATSSSFTITAVRAPRSEGRFRSSRSGSASSSTPPACSRSSVCPVGPSRSPGQPHDVIQPQQGEQLGQLCARVAQPDRATQLSSSELHPGQAIHRGDVRGDQRPRIAGHHIAVAALQQQADALAECRDVGGGDRTAEGQHDGARPGRRSPGSRRGPRQLVGTGQPWDLLSQSFQIETGWPPETHRHVPSSR